ncbi:MAG: metal ABC transporter permease [Candidatus Paceibacterota bacterium]
MFSVISGIFASYYFNLSTGGTIVLIMIAIFTIVFSSKRDRILNR